MSKSSSVEAKLIRLRALRQESMTLTHQAELCRALRDRSNLVAAEAAEIVGLFLLSEFASDLVAAFDRFMIEPEATDKRCRAKIAIIEALNKIGYEKEEVFLRGIRHVQMKPRWGGEEDTAGHLRGSSAFGLVRIDCRDVVLLLAELLTDPEKVARVAAAQALGETRAAAAVPLLRYKASVGDEEPEVTAECLTALMVAAPKESITYVTRFLDSTDEATQGGAAFALAESRRSDALDILKEYFLKLRQGPLQETLLLAISTTRLQPALDFLMETLAGGDRSAALGALSALAIHRHNESLKQNIAVAVAKTGDAALQERFKKKFPTQT